MLTTIVDTLSAIGVPLVLLIAGTALAAFYTGRLKAGLYLSELLILLAVIGLAIAFALPPAVTEHLK